MKRLMVILLIAGMLSAGEAFAVEHFALSNVFTLNMRDPVPMTAEHFALSNVFTLNMRDMVPLGGLEHSALSDLFTLDMRDIPVVNVLSVGALTIKAKEIRQKSGDLWTASGDVSINDFLLVEGDLEIDKACLEVSGSGAIYLKQVPYLGDKIALFAATSFSFDGNLATLAKKAGLETNLTVGFLEYSLDTLKLIPDGVEIGGSIALPEVGEETSGMVEADLSITRTKGLELLGGRIEISKLGLGDTGKPIPRIPKRRELLRGRMRCKHPSLLLHRGNGGHQRRTVEQSRLRRGQTQSADSFLTDCVSPADLRRVG